MFTEKDLRERPVLIKAFMGLDAEVFWQLICRPNCQNMSESGLSALAANEPLVAVVILTYLRLHIPQQTVACLYPDATQPQVVQLFGGTS